MPCIQSKNVPELWISPPLDTWEQFDELVWLELVDAPLPTFLGAVPTDSESGRCQVNIIPNWHKFLPKGAVRFRTKGPCGTVYFDAHPDAGGSCTIDLRAMTSALSLVRGSTSTSGSKEVRP
jgi:hypothetical protein